DNPRSSNARAAQQDSARALHPTHPQDAPFMPITPLRRAAVLALALASLPLSAHAVDNIRPGLWEFRSTHLSVGGLPDMSAQMGQLQQQLKNLPADTRRMIEQQMTQRGVSLGQDGTVRSCITPEQARQDNIFSGKVEGNCTLTD